MSPAAAPLTVTTGRHPYQVAVIAGVTVAGFTLLATGRPPRTMTDHMPHPLVLVWETALVAAGLATLIAAFWRGTLETSLAIEAGANLAVASLIGVFVGVAATAGAVATLLFTGGIAAAALARTAQVLRDLRRLNRARSAGCTAVVPLLAPPDPADPR